MKKISRREFAKQVGIGFGGVMLTAATGFSSFENKRKERPNILFICSDQHSYKYAGFMGHKLVKTPNLDSIAKNGAVFTNTYSGQPVCVPGRTCLMTGMYASDSNSYCNSTVWDGSYPVWGKYLSEEGYYTRAYGKMDLDGSLGTGFEEIKTSHEHKKSPDITSLFRNPLCYRVDERDGVNGKPRSKDHTKDAEITNGAVNFFQKESRNIENPWALYLGYQQPHPPFESNEELFRMYENEKVEIPEVTYDELENLHPVYQQLRNFKGISVPIDTEKIRQATIAYFGMISELDMNIGKVLNALKESGQMDNTYIVYTSDHGESLGNHGLWYKNNLFEDAVRVPLIISGPGISAGMVINAPVSHVDLVPTVLDMVKKKNPDYLRGKSLLPLLEGAYEFKAEAVYSESHSEGNCTGSFMIRKGDWKYIYFTGYDGLLYNLSEDPHEKTNRYYDAECSDILNDLKTELFNRVDPDTITYRAFQKQKKIRDNLAETLTKDELIEKFQKRLGRGQSEILAVQLKEMIY